MNLDRLKQTLERHEGFRPTVYQCTAGRNTIGVGRNLDDVGFLPKEVKLLQKNNPDRNIYDFESLIITKDEALVFLENDIAVCVDFAKKKFHNWDNLSDARQEVIINMIFNLGRKGFLGFRNFISAVKNELFGQAKREMLNSKWAKYDVPNRANELVIVMETGEV